MVAATSRLKVEGRHDRRTVLVIDGDPRDEAAVMEASRASAGERDLVEIFLVPVVINEWAHWELGDNPDLLRFQIEYEQVKWVTELLEGVAHLEGRSQIHLLRSRWKADRPLRHALVDCDLLILSTSSALVRLWSTRMARRADLSTLVIN